MAIINNINKWIDENKNEYIQLLQKTIRFNSVQGNEKDIQNFIADYLKQLGLEVDYWDLDKERLKNHPYFYSNRDDFTNSPNVVGVLRGTGGGKSIILNGHVDVVPEGDINHWTGDPFSGEVKDGRVYGRGSTDMKGGNIALLMAIAAIKELNITLKGDVIFQSVIEEESGGAGTLDAILRGYKADAAIIPEPTNMKIFPKQQGSQWFRISIFGENAHGGTRYHGVSAIDKAFIVIQHLLKLEQLRNERIDDPLYDNIPIPIPINIGKISGGEWPSSVPDLVQIEGRYGIAPGESIEDALLEFENWLKKLSEKDDCFKEKQVKLNWFGARWVPGEIDINHPLMEHLIRNFKYITEKEPFIEASPWGTDGGLLTQVANIPTVIFGPGKTELAHFTDEAIEIDKIIETAKIIAATIIDWCEIN